MNKKLIGVIFTLAAAILLTSIILMVSVVNLVVNKNNKESTVNNSYDKDFYVNNIDSNDSFYDKDSYANNLYDSNTYNNTTTLLTEEALQCQWFIIGEVATFSLRFDDDSDIIVIYYYSVKERKYTVIAGTYKY